MIQWGDKNKPKYLSFVYGKEWDREDFKMFSFRKTPLGWNMNIWRLSWSYDNYENVKSNDEYPLKKCRECGNSYCTCWL